MKSFKLITPFKLHRPKGFPALEKLEHTTECESSKEELLKMHRDMFTIRRIEITCDGEYKARRIRGYLHLYDGQEAIAVGTEAGLTREDDWITSYRCHATAFVRGSTPMQMFCELFGRSPGVSRGKGGSMHMYRKQSNFYGGAAIVGAQVPLGAGLAFAHKFLGDKNCSATFYGDGAANQGQCWEAANMAKLWKLPLLMVIENNQYGMGTSVARSSALTDYYKQGGEIIPGVQVNGMDPLAVKSAIIAAKEHAVNEGGPVFLEMQCYRYHGHSISDPGITYRTKEEVSKIRTSRDPIELVKNHLISAGWSNADELKQIEREIREEVVKALTEAQNAKAPEPMELFADTYTTGKTIDPGKGSSIFRLESWYPSYIRMPDRAKSLEFGAGKGSKDDKSVHKPEDHQVDDNEDRSARGIESENKPKQADLKESKDDKSENKSLEHEAQVGDNEERKAKNSKNRRGERKQEEKTTEERKESHSSA